MMHRLAVVAALALGCFTPAIASQDYATAFVQAFEQACVPGRLTYAATREAVLAAGWVETAADAHPELASLIARMELEAAAEDDLVDASYEYAIYVRQVAGAPHFLVVGRTSAIIGEPDDPLNPWVWVGCHLYNFDATELIDAAPVTALIGNPISHSVDQDGLSGHVWGPPCPMPRTGDTYLSFVAEGSKMAETMPFTGLVMNFTTSELDPGQPVPDPYC